MGAGRFVYVEDVEVLRLTDKAAQVRIDGVTHWLPLSQIEDEGANLRAGEGGYTLAIARWLAEERGIEGSDD